MVLADSDRKDKDTGIATAFPASEAGDEERRLSNPEARSSDAESDVDNGIATEIRLESSYCSSSVAAPSSPWTLSFPSVSPSLRATRPSAREGFSRRRTGAWTRTGASGVEDRHPGLSSVSSLGGDSGAYFGRTPESCPRRSRIGLFGRTGA